MLLSFEGVPLRGTVLGLNCIPWIYGDNVRDPTTDAVTVYLNQFIRETFDTTPSHELRVTPNSPMTMKRARHHIDTALKDRRRSAKSILHGLAFSRRARMMSRYWSNNSPFALGLVDAVMRQGVFVDRMHAIDWLHSPALLGTMDRLITKYPRFVHRGRGTASAATTSSTATPTASPFTPRPRCRCSALLRLVSYRWAPRHPGIAA